MLHLRVYRRQELPLWHSCLIFCAAVVLSLGISAVLLAFQGKPALGGISHLFQGAFGTIWALEDCLVKAVPLMAKTMLPGTRTRTWTSSKTRRRRHSNDD